MPTVVKKDGSKEAFDAEKLGKSVEKAAIDAGVSVGEMRAQLKGAVAKVVKELKSKEEAESKEIRSKILVELENANSDVAEAWRDFDSRYKAAAFHGTYA